MKVENFSDFSTPKSSNKSAVKKPAAFFISNSYNRRSGPPKAKRLKKSDFMPVLSQIFENADPRTTKLPLFEFKVADKFFFYIFEKISLQNFQKTNTYELMCVAFPKCKCRLKIDALITTDFTKEMFSENENWSLVPPKRKTTLIQSHICLSDELFRIFPKLAIIDQKWSIRLSQDLKASQRKRIRILSFEKISNTTGQFSVNHNGNNKNYVLNLGRNLPGLYFSTCVDCTEKSDSSSLHVFAVETVDPDDPTFWNPENWKVKHYASKKRRTKKIKVPPANYEKKSNLRKISSDSELDQISLSENFSDFIKKSLKPKPQTPGGKPKGRPRLKRGMKRSILGRIPKPKKRLKKLDMVSIETDNFRNSRRAKKFSDREIYSESDLDHVEISDDFDFHLSKNIPKKIFS